MGFTANSSDVGMWSQYINFLSGLEEVYPLLKSVDHSLLETEREMKLKQVFDRAIDNIGFTHMGSTSIWIKYIDFEIMRNNLNLVNLYCFMALQTPLKGSDQIINK